MDVTNLKVVKNQNLLKKNGCIYQTVNQYEIHVITFCKSSIAILVATYCHTYLLCQCSYFNSSWIAVINPLSPIFLVTANVSCEKLKNHSNKSSKRGNQDGPVTLWDFFLHAKGTPHFLYFKIPEMLSNTSMPAR